MTVMEILMRLITRHIHIQYMYFLTNLYFFVTFLKGTAPREILPLVFFFKLSLLGPVDMPRNDFNFFRLFAEIFDYFGASMKLAMHALPVSLTSVNNSLPVSTTLVSDTFTVLESFTSVNDTGKKLLTGVIDTGEACIRRCQ
jgi:hypothetical protein